MYGHFRVAGVVALFVTCLVSDASAQPAANPLARVPAGKVVTERTQRGALILSNISGNRFTLELVGKEVKSLAEKQEGGSSLQMWDVDGLLMQVLTLPSPEQADPTRPMALLGSHMKYESDFQAKLGWTEVEAAREWLTFPTGERSLYWEMIPPKKDAPPGPTEVTKMITANTLNGRNIIVVVGSVIAKHDPAQAKRTLTETLFRLVRYEPTVPAVKEEPEGPADGDAMVTLLNDELATRKDKKAEGAVVVQPEKLIQLVRMAAELRGRMVDITFLYDGVAGHTVNLVGYDRKTKEFLYWDSLGNHTFLEAENNHAGVNARRVPNVKERVFAVTESDLQKVMQGILAKYQGIRHYFKSADLKEAVQEYRQLKEKYPDSKEWTEAWLLKAGELLLEIDENGRAFNIFGACAGVHETSSRALAGMAAVNAKVGRPAASVSFYDAALKQLPDDPSLDDAQRKPFAAAWDAARKAQAAKAAKPGKTPVPAPE